VTKVAIPLNQMHWFSLHLLLHCCIFSLDTFIEKRQPILDSERRVPKLIPVLGSQPAGDVSHKPGSRLPLFSTRPTVTPATIKRAATNFAAW